MTHAPCLLILDDEPAILDMVLLSLAPEDWVLGDGATRTPCVATATAGELAGTRFLVARRADELFALAEGEIAAGRALSGGFFDLHLAEGMQGPDAMRRLRELQPGLLCTVVTGLQGDIGSVLEVFAPDHLDEWDFLAKPFTRGEITQRCRQMVAASERRAREAQQLTEIQRLNRELEAWGRSLEARVAQRTEQLAEALRQLREKNEELEAVLDALHQTQAELVQHEKMATIGQLAAGVARELSRPLAFTQSALVGISRSMERLSEFADCVEDQARPRPEASPEGTAIRSAFADLGRSQRPASAAAEARNLGEHAAEGLERALGIVRELSAFAATSSSERKDTDVSATLGAAIDLVRGSLQSPGQLQADLPELSPVVGSAAELQHAWMQLLGNAVEATATRAGDALIRVTAREEAGEIVIEFSDNGEGIADVLRERVFEPFFTTRGRKPGLGLSVVHGIVSRHGGTIEIAPPASEGTLFRIHLPVSRARRLQACSAP